MDRYLNVPQALLPAERNGETMFWRRSDLFDLPVLCSGWCAGNAQASPRQATVRRLGDFPLQLLHTRARALLMKYRTHFFDVRLERVPVDGRAKRDIESLHAGVEIFADAIDGLLWRTHQRARCELRW